MALLAGQVDNGENQETSRFLILHLKTQEKKIQGKSSSQPFQVASDYTDLFLQIAEHFRIEEIDASSPQITWVYPVIASLNSRFLSSYSYMQDVKKILLMDLQNKEEVDFPEFLSKQPGSLQKQYEATKAQQNIGLMSSFLRSMAKDHGFDFKDASSLYLWSIVAQLDSNSIYSRNIHLLRGQLFESKAQCNGPKPKLL